MPSIQFHSKRIAHQLQKEVSWVIANKVNDPRIPNIVTVTDVKLAPDFRNATVHVSIYGDEEQKNEALAALTGAAAFIQRCVASKVKIKHFPKFFFAIDTSLDRSEIINTLLEQVKDDLD